MSWKRIGSRLILLRYEESKKTKTTPGGGGFIRQNKSEGNI